MFENPAGFVYSEKSDKLTVLGTSNSISYGNQGGLDWFLFQMDEYGRNQCKELLI